MQLKDIELQQRIDDGTLLYNTILNRVHKDNLEEMYNYISSHSPNLYCYGDTKEKQLINYCIYKRESVLYMYKTR